jgi:hypothetical protein
MCDRFFKGVVSEQAEKSAKAAYQNAKKGRDSLWALMSGEMYAGKFETFYSVPPGKCRVVVDE